MNEIDKTPRQIVAELDKYVIGQDSAKRAIAVALRNRYRRMQLPKDMQEDISPKNLLMIGPTGVGKTEIARRLAKIVNAPFVKVEATKFTEVGYVGRDVESMARDLVEVAYRMEQNDAFKQVRAQAAQQANKRLVKLIVPAKKKQENPNQYLFNALRDLQSGSFPNMNGNDMEEVTEDVRNERLSVAEQLKRGLLENNEVTIQVDDPSTQFNNQSGMLGQMGIDLSSLSSMMPTKKVERTMTVAEAREILIKEESEKLVNSADLADAAIKRAENTGIIFIDEIDKIASKSQQNAGQVSREGVQRDILPIVEGSQISTKYGLVKTDHILFIGSGAFHESKPSDLIAELQGRFPIRVELEDLSVDDFHRIAEVAYQLNHDTENIGARRLHTILEKLLEDLLFEGPDMQMGDIKITEAYVNDKIGSIVEDKDLSQYIL